MVRLYGSPPTNMLELLSQYFPDANISDKKVVEQFITAVWTHLALHRIPRGVLGTVEIIADRAKLSDQEYQIFMEEGITAAQHTLN